VIDPPWNRVKTVSVNDDKVDHPYPYFGLRERRHREIRHDPLEHGGFDWAAVMLQRTTHEVVESSL